MRRRSVIIKEIVLACLELLMPFLSVTLAHWKTLTMKIVHPGKIYGVPITVTRDVASGTNYHQFIKNPLPPAVVAEIQSLSDRLGSKEFLASCEDVKTQNVNESYHHDVWNLAPKEQLNSPLEIKLAVAIATLLFNSGMKSTYNSIFIDAGITVSENMLLQWEDMGNKRKQEKLWKQKDETKLKRKTLKQRNISNKLLSILRVNNINLVLFTEAVVTNISNYIFSVYYKI